MPRGGGAIDTDEQCFFGATGDFLRLRHLTLRGTNFEIGRTLGRLAVENHALTPERLRGEAPYARARRVFMQASFPLHWERMRGIAAALGLDAEDDRYDFTGLPYLMELPLTAAGCSAVYYPPATTATGHGCLSRNYEFSIGSIAELMRPSQQPNLRAPLQRDAYASLPEEGRMPLPKAGGPPLHGAMRRGQPPVMSEPYLMAWYPSDGGYASIAVHAFDLAAGALEGLNSAGLSVAILADHDALSGLGPLYEPHPGPQRVVGLHELAVTRLLLDTCATAAEAEDALLGIKQYYRLAPLHYIVADRHGRSFVYEHSTGSNSQHVVEDGDRPLVVTNFQLHSQPPDAADIGAEPTLENEAFYRYRRLTERIGAKAGGFTAAEMKETNACAGSQALVTATKPGNPLRETPSRTLWQSLHDLEECTMEISFYLGEDVQPDGTWRERRSEFLRFGLRES